MRSPQWIGTTFSVPPTCPYTFQQGMPPGVFCVYDGVALAADGSVCGDHTIVIWARLAAVRGGDMGLQRPSVAGDVYFGFVDVPELILRARADAGDNGRATLVDYTRGPGQPRIRTSGRAEMRLTSWGDDVLSLQARRSIPLTADCAFTSYDGTFLAVMAIAPEP